jgi:hypothetical protein
MSVPVVGFVGWRGMVGSVLLERMQEEGDCGSSMRSLTSVCARSEKPFSSVVGSFATRNFVYLKKRCRRSLGGRALLEAP